MTTQVTTHFLDLTIRQYMEAVRRRDYLEAVQSCAYALVGCKDASTYQKTCQVLKTAPVGVELSAHGADAGEIYEALFAWAKEKVKNSMSEAQVLQ